ncbi:transcription factor bHLH93-like [Arachis stenosperma]|uniref:transcription factor bHLH93-like n=1 Tax=Arachis stenosperma TaxID=217475 RepID=UPI0025AC97CD|nr:transcription factor bHLH93-like [Arachis stenosperma]
MELYDHDFLDELMSLRRETWESTNNNPCDEEGNYQLLFPNNNGWGNSGGFDHPNYYSSPSSILVPNSSYSCSSSSYQEVPQNCNDYYCDTTFNEIYSSLLEEFSAPQINNSDTTTPPPILMSDHQEDYNNSNNNNENPLLVSMLVEEELQSLEMQRECKMEASQSSSPPVFNSERKNNNRSKKVEGQPSKNLMAERRRRKRLNDRLSMLRSIVPKISKMDRTSILGDTIDYMKELLDKINTLKQEIQVVDDSNGILSNDIHPNDILVRNSPKFDVERRNNNGDTRVEICCGGKPGMLLSTVNTLEALGLDIQHCVISCFNDFTMQASCSEELEQKRMVSSEDIKQALFRTAGYGGRCF